MCAVAHFADDMQFMTQGLDFPAFLRNLYACGAACSRLAAHLLLRVASSGDSPLLDILLSLLEEAVETADSTATLSSFFSVLRAAMPRNAGVAYARSLSLFAALAQKIQVQQILSFFILFYTFCVYFCLF